MKSVYLLCLALLLPALHSSPTPTPKPAPHLLAAEGNAFAQSSCASCHAIGRSGTSRRSNAPPFPVIVNQEGLTRETLSVWLRGAHNYPSEMDFHLGDREVSALVAYMLTLRDPNYRRPPD